MPSMREVNELHEANTQLGVEMEKALGLIKKVSEGETLTAEEAAALKDANDKASALRQKIATLSAGLQREGAMAARIAADRKGAPA